MKHGRKNIKLTTLFIISRQLLYMQHMVLIMHLRWLAASM